MIGGTPSGGSATERRSQAREDVMAGGGWRDLKALQTACQHADPETVLRLVERGAGGGIDPVPAGRKKPRAGTGKRTGEAENPTRRWIVAPTTR